MEFHIWLRRMINRFGLTGPQITTVAVTITCVVFALIVLTNL